MNTAAALTELPLVSKRGASAKLPSSSRPHLNIYLTIFALAGTLALATASECHSITYIPSLLYGGTLWLWWGCIASVMWKLGTRAPSALSFSWKTLPIHILAAVVLGVFHLLLLTTPIAGWTAHVTPSVLHDKRVYLLNLNRFGMEILIYGFVFGIVGTIRYRIHAQRDAIASIELQRELAAAHLRALQMQLEPHFLFNTLNAITTLVELDRRDQAVAALSHLNAMLKTTLTHSTPQKVPLSQELEIVDSYLAIEQVRFADRLRIELRIDPNALDGLVPCFLLQPIVENAIRHGIANCEDNGVVEASARREGNSLHLRVRDTGRDPKAAMNRSPQNGHGIGLRNTRERLTHFYRDDYSMKAQPLDAGGFEVAITIPYERI
jgi:hypothetical protein